jgi:hypothetical protein
MDVSGLGQGFNEREKLMGPEGTEPDHGTPKDGEGASTSGIGIVVRAEETQSPNLCPVTTLGVTAKVTVGDDCLRALTMDPATGTDGDPKIE